MVNLVPIGKCSSYDLDESQSAREFTFERASWKNRLRKIANILKDLISLSFMSQNSREFTSFTNDVAMFIYHFLTLFPLPSPESFRHDSLCISPYVWQEKKINKRKDVDVNNVINHWGTYVWRCFLVGIIYNIIIEIYLILSIFVWLIIITIYLLFLIFLGVI